MMLHAVVMIVPNVVGTYYMIYYMGQPQSIAIYFGICSIAGIATAPITSIALKRINAKTLTMVAMTICLGLSVAAFFVPTSSPMLLFTIFAVFGFVMPVPMVTITSLLVEEGHSIYKKTGKRKDGVLFSLNSFAIKCGTALASGIVSAVLALTHYDATAQMQNTSVLIGINATRTIILAIVYLIAIVVLRNFKIQGEEK